jgi:multiple sugar transport system substrate-binding protein
VRTLFNRPRLARFAAALGVAVLALAGCGSEPTPTPSDTDVEAALAKGGKITVWSWEPTLKSVVADFEAKYTNVDVELVNAGTGDKQYTALQNAITAGSGVPDVAHVEYYALPQFALANSVADLRPFGAGDLDGTFTPGPWNGVRVAEAVYGLPMDSGPMALFYNDEVFKKHNVTVPTTWAEYVDAARKLHSADPNVYIANDTGDAGFTTSMIWQAGGRPYKVDGTTVTIDFSDAGSRTFAETWQALIDEKLLSPVSSWSDGWYKGLGDGTIATLTIGAWMPANLESGVAAGAGKWRVAPMPQWEAGATVSAENGGSSLAVPAASQNKALAYAFVRYATTSEGATTRASEGAFPATVADLTSSAFVDKEFTYFGGQKVNQVLADAARNVATGWSYLPFQVYANSIFNDTVGQAYVSPTKLTDGLSAWEDACRTYGSDQGFTIA